MKIVLTNDSERTLAARDEFTDAWFRNEQQVELVKLARGILVTISGQTEYNLHAHLSLLEDCLKHHPNVVDCYGNPGEARSQVARNLLARRLAEVYVEDYLDKAAPPSE